MNETLIQRYGEQAAGIREVILSEEQIQHRVREMAAQISQDYAGLQPLAIAVLKGVVFFMADLLRALTIPVEMDFMAVSSYSPETRQRGLVRLVKDLDLPIAGRHVIFVEDIIDTGLTLSYVLRTLRGRSPASLEVCVLFNKPNHRLIEIPVRYTGFDLPEGFVIGYGLDYKEHYRHLPFVGFLKPHVFQADGHGEPKP